MMTERRNRVRDDGVIQFFDTACQAFREGLFSDAVEALERVLESDVDFPGASSALKCAGFWKEHLDAERAANDGFEQGEQLFALWRLFQAFVGRLGDVPERVQFALKQYVFTAALACYLSAAPDVEQEGGDPDVLLQVGRCCRGIGNYERAIACLERANRERRDDARILSELADCYSLVNESRSAKAFFREAYFIDPQAVDIEGLESPLIRRLAARVRSRGIEGAALNEWIPVYGVIWGVFNVKREMKPLEFGKLKQAIYQLEKETRSAGAPPGARRAGAGMTLPGAAEAALVPRLINRYMWLIDHYLTTGEPRERIDEVLARIRDIDPGVHADYTT
jgi:tetratricopeptide (TPR) repeat protein